MTRLVSGCGWASSIGIALLVASCVDLPPVTEPEPNDDDPSGRFVDRAGSGSLRVTGVVRSADLEASLPLGGVRIVLGDAAAISRVDGSFVLVGVPVGSQLFIVDGTHLMAGDGRYGQYASRVSVTQELQTVFDRPVYLPFIPGDSARQIDPNRETIVTAEGGLSIIIPPGAAVLGESEYAGVISVVTVHPDRTPLALPDGLAKTASVVLTIQPAGVEFLVPARIRYFAQRSPEADGPARSALPTQMSLLTLTPSDGLYRDTGFLRRADDGFETIAGGIGVSGWHALAGPRVSLVAPCNRGDADESRACLRVWMAALTKTLDLGTPTVAGAAGPIENVRASLLFRGQTVEEATRVLRATVPDFEIALEQIASAGDFYQQMIGIEGVRESVQRARGQCDGDRGRCRSDGSAPLDPASGGDGDAKDSDPIDEAIDEIALNVGDAGPRIARLGAALRALEPFFTNPEQLTEVTLPLLDQAADEYLTASSVFDPPDSAFEAYHALLDARNRLEAALRATVERFSIPAGTSDGDSTVLLRVCSDEGVRSVGIAKDGTAPLSLGELNSDASADCVVLALDTQRDICSAAVSEADFLDRLSPPLMIALDRSITRRRLDWQTPVFDAVDDESPVHFWTFETPVRRGIEVTFVPEGRALATLATSDGLAQVARVGGFHLSNLSSGGPTAIQIIGIDTPGSKSVGVDGSVPYAFTARAADPRLDFGEPITGSFDLLHRAESILFDAAAGQRIFVERVCCDRGQATSTFAMVDPEGNVVSPVLGSLSEPGVGDEIFDISSTGLHRVVLVPSDGAFVDYEIIIRNVATQAPINYELDTIASVVFTEPGQAVSYQFDAIPAATLRLEGLTSVNVDPVVVSVVDPEGVAIVSNALLYFDQSSFSRMRFETDIEGQYLLTFHVPLDGVARTGSMTFRLGLEQQ